MISSKNRHGEEDPETARRRIAEETARIQLETELARKRKMKALIGDDAESAQERQTAVQQALHDYTYKGTHPEEKAKPDLVELLPIVEQEVNLQRRKEEYHSRVEAFRHKGKEHLLVEDGDHDGYLHSPSRLSSEAAAAAAVTSGGSTSPRKAYLALAEQNALRSDIGAPTLYVYDSAREEGAKKAGQPATVNALTPRGWDGCTYYTLVDLRQRRVPKDIDWKNREQYLSPDEFANAFEGMTKDEFAAQPKWKRDKMKQKVYLF